MSMPKKLLFAALLVPGLLIPALWYLAVPLDAVTDRARFSLGGTEARLVFQGLSKGLPFTVTADRLTIRTIPNQTRKTPLELTCSSFAGNLTPKSLIFLSPEVVFSCLAYGGTISGSAGLASPREVVIRGEEIELSETPVPSMYGVTGKGKLFFEYRRALMGGELKFQISDARIENAPLPPPFPLQDFRTIRGVLDLKPKGVEIRSLSLESPGAHAKIQGHIGDKISGVIEFTLENPYALDPSYAKALTAYVVSPGHWSIPFTLDRIPIK